jgi:hypothetical protein
VSDGPDGVGLLYALKSGVVPRDGIVQITVGRTLALRRMRSVLREVAPDQKTKLEFVEGDYGEGKSHLLSLIRQDALSKGFPVASFVADFDSAALHRPKPVLRAITRSLELPGRPEIGLTPLLRNLAGTKRFPRRVDDLYETWANPRTSQRLFESLSIWPPGLRAFVEDPRAGDLLLRWMGGDEVLVAPVRRRILDASLQTPRRMAVTTNELPYMLHGLANSLHRLGFGGLVVLIDELENGLSSRATAAQRRRGVSLLAQLCRGHAALMIVGAVTPPVYTTLYSDSLYLDAMKFWKADFDQVVRRLKGDAPLRINELAAKDLLMLGEKVISIHEAAFGWSVSGRLSNDALEWLAQDTSAGHRPVRDYVRTLVELLELCEQDRRFRVGPPRSDGEGG